MVVKNKICSELAFSTIVIAIISLFILVVLVMFVSGNFRGTSRVTRDLEIGNRCESLGGVCLTRGFYGTDYPGHIEDYDYYVKEKGVQIIKINGYCTGRNIDERFGERGVVQTSTIYVESKEVGCYLV